MCSSDLQAVFWVVLEDSRHPASPKHARALVVEEEEEEERRNNLYSLVEGLNPKAKIGLRRHD